MKHASRALVVERTSAECFEAVMDFETCPEWQDAIHSCEVRKRNSLGIHPGFWVPNKVVAILTSPVMQRSVRDLKDRVERRVGRP